MDQVTIHKCLKTIASGFIQAKLTGMCLYGSVLVKERLGHEGIPMRLVAGYVQTATQESMTKESVTEELYRHVWLEDENGQIYDIGWLILDTITSNHHDQPIYHYQLPSNVTRTDLLTFDKQRLAENLEHGIQLYQTDPYGFWSEFDGCYQPEMKSLRLVINKIRDSFLD